MRIRRFLLGLLLLFATVATGFAADPLPSPGTAPPTAADGPPPTSEQCDDGFEACLEACDKSMPDISGEMLCTGCGWDCNVVHKKCLAKAYYHQMFGASPKP